MSAPIQVPPRGALIFANADFDQLELRTLAQACLLMTGQSELARVLNANEDPHLQMAANMLGLTYDEAKLRHKAEKQARKAAFEFFKGQVPDAHGRFVPTPCGDAEASVRAGEVCPTPVDDARQAGKVANFGFPGGLGAEKLCLFARKTYKVLLTEPQAKELKRTWLGTFPEFRRYFDTINAMMQPEGATFRHLFSGRVRGNTPYTATCNSFFQGLGADATGAGLFLISEACYTPTPCRACSGACNGCDWCRCVAPGVSAMYGSRLVNYVHDDDMTETVESRGHEVAHELVRLMIEGASPYLPDVPATAKPVLSRFWSKDAEQVWIEDPAAPGGKGKRLVAWPKAA